ncbi:MAG TPA: carbohydrate porin, partial [Chthoniobacterales bacterium]
MKRLLLPYAVVLSFLAAAPLPAESGHLNINGETNGHPRFWDYYTPCPSNYIGSSLWWQGETLTGDWWGTRNWLKDSGVEVVFNYTTNLAGNPVGGQSQGFTYTDNIYFGLQLDLEKLAGWNGAQFTISGLDRNGTSLSQNFLGNQFTVQQIYGG